MTLCLHRVRYFRHCLVHSKTTPSTATLRARQRLGNSQLQTAQQQRCTFKGHASDASQNAWLCDHVYNFCFANHNQTLINMQNTLMLHVINKERIRLKPWVQNWLSCISLELKGKDSYSPHKIPCSKKSLITKTLS